MGALRAGGTLLLLSAGLVLLLGVGRLGADTPAHPPKPRTHSVRGIIEGFDAAAGTLTVKGAKATWIFLVAEAKAWKEAKSVALEDLADTAGFKVTVKYQDRDGRHVATTVRVSASRENR